MDYKAKAAELLKAWKPNYTFGIGITDTIGRVASRYGKRILVVANRTRETMTRTIIDSLEKEGCTIVAVAPGAKPNAPREDVYRISTYILHHQPNAIVAVGGGSSIDAVKAASVLATLGGTVSPEIDTYFGTGKVATYLKETGRELYPVIAYETAASSAAHLTKYSNVTDPTVGQKKLIVDPAIEPASPFFDYAVTASLPSSVTIDGALDTLAHTFEVFCGAKGESYEKCREIAETAFSLVLDYGGRAVRNPKDMEAREALGLASDLGGYAIMVGGTSGGHLTSFSLVDCAAHGTACGIMNPYYAVFYSKAIQPQLHAIGRILRDHGFTKDDVDTLDGRELAESVASAMMAFSSSIGAPTKLSELPLFQKEVHLPRALKAAKDPDLKMKLQNMPVPLTSDDVEAFMAPVLEAAVTGDLSLIKEMN